jgi:glucokinase
LLFVKFQIRKEECKMKKTREMCICAVFTALMCASAFLKIPTPLLPITFQTLIVTLSGLILGGRLYSGTNGNAGEVGHIRLSSFGPVGYGKAGSWEGFCSGGGISQLAYMKATEMAQCGKFPSFYKKGMTAADISAKSVAEAARNGDECALEVYRLCGEYLGRGLSVVIDILNPERIVIGSIFTRSRDLLWEEADKVIKREVLAPSYSCCEVVGAELGEQIGDYGAITVALYGEGIF